MNNRNIKNCKHSVIGSMNVDRCVNCNRTFATIRKEYIDKIKELQAENEKYKKDINLSVKFEERLK